MSTHDWRQERLEKLRSKIFPLGPGVLAEVDALLKDYFRLLDAYCKTSEEVEQTLAQAIGGYPWYKDDQVNFPGATEANGVCVGEHVAESLAMDAASVIKDLRAEVARLKDLLKASEDIIQALNKALKLKGNERATD